MSAKLCLNCLNSNHDVESCNLRGRCIVCGGKHHSKLHRESASATPPSLNTHATTQEVHGISTVGGNNILLSTAYVVLQSASGQSLTVRALLDSGAEESFLMEHVAQALSLRKKPIYMVDPVSVKKTP